MSQKKKEVKPLFLNFKFYKDDQLVMDYPTLEYKKEGNIILFTLDNIEHQIDTHEKTLERYNDEFHFYINFLKYTCTYELKSHQATFDIIVDSAMFLSTDGQIELTYAIETDDSKNKIIITFENVQPKE